MAVESPADIFIVGHNRLAVEAGLYARFLGYRMTILGGELSRSLASDDNGQWTLQNCTTPLGLKALESHGLSLKAGDIVDADSLFDRYVIPVCHSDLLVESFIGNCVSVAAKIGESELPEKIDEDVEYDTRVFDLTVSNKKGETSSFVADVLIDARDASEMEQVLFSPSFNADWIGGDKKNSDPSDRLLTSTDDFYVLGSQLDPSGSEIEFAAGLSQIVDLFKIINDRPMLSLYSEN